MHSGGGIICCTRCNARFTQTGFPGEVSFNNHDTEHSVNLNTGLGAKININLGVRHFHEPTEVGSTGSDPNSLASRLKVTKKVLSERFGWTNDSITNNRVLDINPHSLTMEQAIPRHFSNEGYVLETDAMLGFINSSQTVEELARAIQYRGPSQLTYPLTSSDAH